MLRSPMDRRAVRYQVHQISSSGHTLDVECLPPLVWGGHLVAQDSGFSCRLRGFDSRPPYQHCPYDGMVDIADLKSADFGREGSTPSVGTSFRIQP